MEKFKGRVVIEGAAEGEALVSHGGFNILASFMGVLTKSDDKAVCTDQNNPELYKKVLSDTILCIPQVIGSTTAGMIIQAVAALDVQPKAMLFSHTAESLAISGVILADVWENKKIITIDGLGDTFLEKVQNGQKLQIKKDGTVIIQD